MEWKDRERSSNVEDIRESAGGNAPNVDRSRKRKRNIRAAGGVGIGAIIIAFIVMIFGGDPSSVTGSTPAVGNTTTDKTPQPKGRSNKEDEQAEFVEVVLKDTETAWHKIFRDQLQQEYVEPTLVLYTDKVKSGCGKDTKETGPFYCSYDQKLYIDLSFADELRDDYDAPGDFAMAYIVAHEVGHHVQYLLGTFDEVQEQQENLSKKKSNELSVRLELQADFYAGVWAHYADKMQHTVENGDIEEAIRAAHGIGDDQLARDAGEKVRPETFDHGTSAQRMRWYKKGYDTGLVKDGDTFNAKNL